jgi:hypothetical protein
MVKTAADLEKPTTEERHHMHALYRQGGQDRHRPPHIIYQEVTCSHPGCGQKMQGIDFRLDNYGPAIHDPLVKAWWNDTGFAGRCPNCGGWIHFTIHGKTAIAGQEANALPQLPEAWYANALIL